MCHAVRVARENAAASGQRHGGRDDRRGSTRAPRPARPGCRSDAHPAPGTRDKGTPRPWRHSAQVPHDMPGLIITRSPGRTMPSPHCQPIPRSQRRRSPRSGERCRPLPGSPSATNRSRRLRAAARTRTRTSCGARISGAGTSARARWASPPTASRTSARMRKPAPAGAPVAAVHGRTGFCSHKCSLFGLTHN